MGDKGGMGTSMTAGSGAAMGAQLTGSTAGLGEGVLGGRGTACMGGGGEGEKIGLGYRIISASGGGSGLGGGQTTKVLSFSSAAPASVITMEGKDGLRPKRSSRSAV